MQCEYERDGLGRCQNQATHVFVRYDWPNRPADDAAFTCDNHKMGDGQEGRRYYLWREVPAAGIEPA